MTEMIVTFTRISSNTSVRQILGRRGEVWLPESGVDQWVMIGE